MQPGQLVNLIREIQSQVKHLRRSNQELQAAGFFPFRAPPPVLVRETARERDSTHERANEREREREREREDKQIVV